MHNPIVFISGREVDRRQRRSRSARYRNISAGLLTRPVQLGSRAVGWPEHEIEALNRARLAGADDDAIRALVDELHMQRSPAEVSR
jgi:prophage regulatory protein